MALTQNNSHGAAAPAKSQAQGALRGSITVPGDKSISHRALMLASQALGTTTVHGLLEGEDVLCTAKALQQCGVPITKQNDGSWVISGVGIHGLHAPADVLDMGNAGTAVRLMMGLLAPYPFTTHFTGDESLCKRPMARVTNPLQEMGARFDSREGGRLPIAMQGSTDLLPIHYTLPMASAQVKSAILLAALATRGTTTVVEPEATRDHTERMLRFFGIAIDSSTDSASHAVTITLNGLQAQSPQERQFTVPADPSSAAFPIVAALITPGSEVTVTNVCLNPLRTGLFTTLQEMGAQLTISNRREVGGEEVGDITARHSALRGVTVPAERAPSMIDEYPVLSIAAAFANGDTAMLGLDELRVKESDRLSAILNGLQQCGVAARAEGNDLFVSGNGTAPAGGGPVVTHYDHRIAMSFLVMGMAAQSPVTVDDVRAIATSFPGFMGLMRGLGAEIHD
ncbi:MAG: 3-phosphoshikimate 1-carboxyvinyltransferase [Azospirillum brasilense]|nr:MAG: 3-phosphoshikimate 1-carboxyvinyltransferase [Azospirillum brasilense]